jgi:hypothetical protein
MMTVQQAIIDLLRLRSEKLEAEQSCDIIPPFLRMTADERRQAWIDYDSKRVNNNDTRFFAS